MLIALNSIGGRIAMKSHLLIAVGLVATAWMAVAMAWAQEVTKETF
jgi:hypothetical protein